ncbi:MAG: hypothetical protein AABX07_01380 [Nanoarchaeota archaeon]
MKKQEILQITAAILVLTAVSGFQYAINSDWLGVLNFFIFSAILIMVAVFSKKSMARILDADVEHEIWQVSRYGFKPSWHLKKEIPGGIIFPIFFSIFSLGLFKVPTLLTYETTALKRRAARRFGYYSFTEMTEWHIAIIGAAGTLAVLILSAIMYFYGSENFAILATLYAFFNMIPISKLDGTQIFFGSKVLWTILAVLTLIFTFYALVISLGII